MAKKLRIGEMLVEAGILSRQQLEEALNAQLIYGGKLGTNLVEHGFVTEEFLTSFLSKQCNVPAVDAKDLEDIPAEVIELVPRELANRHKVIPFRRDKRRLDVVLLDPTNLKAIDELSFKSGLLIRPFVAPEVLIARCLERYYQVTRARRYIQVAGEHDHALSSELPGRSADPSTDGTSSSAPSGGGFAAASAVATFDATIGLPDAFPDRPMALSQVVYELQSVETPAQIINLILRFSRPYFKKRGIFVLRADFFERVAVEGSADLERRTEKLSLAIKEPNIFHTVFTSKRYHLGTLPANSENFEALDALGEEPSSAVLVLPLIYNQRVELILVACGFTPLFTVDHVRRFQLLMEKAGFAHQILLLKSRLRLLPDELQ
jgi:hypothetical protein